MSLTIRAAAPGDAKACGRIIFEAFAAIADAHNFPRDFPSVEIATGVAGMLVGHPKFNGVVAEENGSVIASVFMDTRGAIAGIGPITVDPNVQNRGVGRRLMQEMIDRAAISNPAGVRLVQAAYHNRSNSLYTRLGFVTREPLSVIQGPPLAIEFPGLAVRAAKAEDMAACNTLCRRVHGFDRGGELADAIKGGTATVVERRGQIAGYATEIGFLAHAVAADTEALKALIGAAKAITGPGLLLPTRNHELFRWCLDNKLRLVQQMTLMTIGLYNEPSGAYLPSILY